MLEEALNIQLLQVGLVLDVRTKEFRGLLTLQTSSGVIECPTEVEVAQNLIQEITSGPQNPKSSSSPQEPLSPENIEPTVGLIEDDYEEEPDSPLINEPQPSPQEEVDDLEAQILRQMGQAASTVVYAGEPKVETYDDDAGEEEAGQTKIP